MRDGGRGPWERSDLPQPADLEPEEQELHRLLASVPPVPPPLGFRDAVMRRLSPGRRSIWEGALAAALAIPSIAFIVWELAVHGADFAAGLEQAFALAGSTQAETFFFVDGLVVLAFAVLGAASLLGADALIRAERAR